MPGPNSTPNGTIRNTKQLIPAKLAARIAEWERDKTGRPFKTAMHKPGSQK